MKFEIESLSDTRKRVKVEVPAEDVTASLDKAYNKLNKTVSVPGFRPGKVPRAILEKKYGKEVEQEAIERIVPEYYFRAITEAKLNPVDNPKFDEKFDITAGQPINFSCSVDVRPEFTLAEYKGIEVAVEEPVVTDEEMDRALEQIAEANSSLEPVTEDRPAANGDFVVIDFEGFLGETAFKGGKAEKYPLELGGGAFIPGFEEQVIGMKKGDNREIKVTFPSEYRNTELAGKEVTFKVVANDIKKKVKAELTDDLAKRSGMGDTLEHLRDRIREDILGYKKRGVATRQKDQILKKIAEINSMPLPESMLRREMQAMAADKQRELSGTPEADKFDFKAWEAEAKPAAEERVKTTLVLAAIADKENIVVSDEEVEAGIKKLAAETGYDPKGIRELYMRRDGSLDGLRGILGDEKVLDFLLNEAKKG
jgi:trigger factor